MPDHFREPVRNRLVSEQSLVELTLHALGQIGPVATDDLHANELHAIAGRVMHQPGVTLARSACAASCVRQEEPEIELFELQLQLAAHAPVLFDVPREIGVQ